jgi:PAS domain S-box-containing protein
MTISSAGKIKFPFLSESVIEHFELTKDEINNQTLAIIANKILKEDFLPFMLSLESAMENLENWQHEFRCDWPAKGMRYYRVRATIEKDLADGFVLYGRVSDNTENRIQAMKLKVSEERYQFALEASSEGIWDLNLKTNQVFFSSQSMKMLYFEEKDTVSSIDKWDNRIHPDDIIKYKHDIQLHLDAKIPFYKNLQRVRTKKNDYKWVLSRGKIIEKDDKGNALRVIGTHTDISVQIEKEQDLKRTLEILSSQNKRLLNFAHIVSHNLRSHAGNFKMLLDLIDTEENPEIVKETLAYIRINSDDLNETIDNLKELVDMQSDLKPMKEHLNLRQYLERMIILLKEEFIRHHVNFEITIPNDETVYFNPAYFESVLLNFSTNAVKYSHPDRLPKINYHFSCEDGVKTLSITDNGLGIDLKKHGDSIFGIYKTFHKHPNSKELGLFMSKNQIEAMGGKVTVISEVGKGTSFKIYFND